MNVYFHILNRKLTIVHLIGKVDFDGELQLAFFHLSRIFKRVNHIIFAIIPAIRVIRPCNCNAVPNLHITNDLAVFIINMND